MVTGYIVRLNTFGVDVQNPATLLRLRLAAFIHADSHVFWYCYHIETHFLRILTAEYPTLANLTLFPVAF